MNVITKSEQRSKPNQTIAIFCYGIGILSEKKGLGLLMRTLADLVRKSDIATLVSSAHRPSRDGFAQKELRGDAVSFDPAIRQNI